jgi:hypothetical protein
MPTSAAKLRIGIAIEPRFTPKGRLGRIGDMPIPTVGQHRIE